jgi:hypothetical protein
MASKGQLGSGLPLPRGYQPWWAKVSDHLGGIYPFIDSSEPDKVSLDIATLIDARKERGEPVRLDTTGLIVKTALPFILGDRTLLQGIRRAPWMSFPQANGEWYEASLPPHGMAQPDLNNFVRELRVALLNEVQDYIYGARTVGILLSGGMDSRVLAGVVRAVQEVSDNSFDVVGLTWGSETSRDVVYARRITDRFGWSWKHYPITAETLRSNIFYMAKMGAEVSPLHLHAMPQVAATDGLDVVLAGSYGDSVGRAEFSGRRVTQLKDVLPKQLDRFGVLLHSAVEESHSTLQADVAGSQRYANGTSTLRRREIEQEMHYMRRMLQSCMMCIANKTKFFQLFTDPKVFGLMWGLDPRIRDNRWYQRLLALLPGNLLDIPWARTGRRYDQADGQADNFDSKFHAYGHWMRLDLRDEIIQRVNSNLIRDLGIFNHLGLDLALRAWGRASTKTTNSLDELVSWLAALHDCIEHFSLDVQNAGFTSNIRDSLQALLGGARSTLYVSARDKVRD